MHCKIIMKIPNAYSSRIKNNSSERDAKRPNENEEPVKVRKSKERNYALPLEFISARSLNTANVRGLGMILF